MTRAECEAALEAAPRALRSDDVQAAILATLLRIEAQSAAPPPEAAPKSPRTPRKPRDKT